MREKVELDHYTGQIVAAAIGKTNAIKKAGQDDVLFKSANELSIPNFDGKYKVSDIEIGKKHSSINISFEENGEICYIHAKFCEVKLVLTKKDMQGNNLASNTMQLAA